MKKVGEVEMIDQYQKAWESIGKALSKQSEMILWIAERTLSAKDFKEFVDKFAKNQKTITTNCLIIYTRKGSKINESCN